MKPKRKSLSKKLRFEVFKRDSFKCQYCGESAPDVILHVDHIHPVSKGGNNDIMNLITSCQSCNSGKGAVTLDDSSVIEKQRKQLEELNERREQLESMLQWREGLKVIDDRAIDAVCDVWHEATCERSSINDSGRKTVKTLLKNFGLNTVLDAVDTAIERYAKYDDGVITDESAGIAFNKIGGIARMNSMPDDERQLYYIRGIVRNRVYCNDDVCIKLLRDARSLGCDVDYIQEYSKTTHSWTAFRETVEEMILEAQDG